MVGSRRPVKGLREQHFLRRFPEKWIGADGRPGLVFDLSGDPGEIDGKRGEGMPAELRELVASGGPSGASEPGEGQEVYFDAEARAALEALGYADGAGR